MGLWNEVLLPKAHQVVVVVGMQKCFKVCGGGGLWSLWFPTLIFLPPHHSPSLFLIFLARVWEYCSKHWRRQNLLYFICHLWNSTFWFLIGWNWRPTWNHLWEKHCKSGEGLSSEYCLYVNPNLCDLIGFRDAEGIIRVVSHHYHF